MKIRYNATMTSPSPFRRSLCLWIALASLPTMPIPGNAQSTESGPLMIFLLEEPHFYGFHFRTWGTPPEYPGLDTLCLTNLELQNTPLLTINHFKEYCAMDNTFELTSEGMERISTVHSPPHEPSTDQGSEILYGIPFVATTGTKRLFCGTFWSSLSSFHGSIGPTIELTRPWQCRYFREHLPEVMNRDRCWGIAWPNPYGDQDSRFSIPNARAEFVDAFRRAGKLVPNCGASDKSDGSLPTQG
ncbi:MAG: hypothetical protein ABIK65_07125 [Candidatus Eisenbacteria bacterium]